MSFLTEAARHCLDDGNLPRVRPLLVEAARQDGVDQDWWFLLASLNAAEDRHQQNLVPLWLAFEPDRPNVNLIVDSIAYGN